MKCWKCGAELAPDAAFCSSCGAAQNQTPPKRNDTRYQTPPKRNDTRYQTPPTGGSSGTPAVLTIFAAVCAMVYGGLALRSLFYAVTGLLRSFVGFYFPVLVTALFNGLSGLLGLTMCAVLVMTAIRRTPQNSDGLLVCAGGIGAALVVLRLVSWLFQRILLYYSGSPSALLKSLFGAAFTVAGIYVIERFLLGEEPLVGKSADDLRADVQYTLGTLGQAAGEAGAQASQAAANARAEREARAARQSAQYDAYGPGYAAFRLKEDRSLIVYILLTFVTCGIYGWYFIYALARDVNVACAGDGKTTPGLLKLILLSLVTCGFYSFYWYYSLGNRLADNAPRYGMSFQENGTTVLLWYLVGMLACGLGPLVAMYIIIRNTNSLCSAYNYQQGI